jgi:hypothetical protein
VRGTLKDIEVGCRGGVQARRYQAGSLKPLQDLHKSHEALWTRLRSSFFLMTHHRFLSPIAGSGIFETYT